MAFADEVSWSIDAIRAPGDEPSVPADVVSWSLVDSTTGGTTTSAVVDKKGAKWRTEIYHSRRVERQEVLG